MNKINDIQAVRFVVLTYAKICADLLNIPVYKLGMPPANSVLFSNCLDYFFVAEAQNINLRELMIEGLAVYPEEWLMRTFDRPYPPLSVITSKKCLSMALKHIPKKAKTVNEDQNIESIVEKLKGIDSNSVDFFLANNLFGVMDLKIQEKIKERLKYV